jgi:hypothetical protein
MEDWRTELRTIKMADLKRVVESMLRRLLEVIEREGGCTKY